MKIELIPIDDLIPYANNARTHSEEQVLQIASSIKEFGFNAPILIDAKNGIIAGHGRVMAARKLKIEQAPCVRIEHLSEAQKKAYILADNRIALNSGWDYELLTNELSQLSELDVDLGSLGFDEKELNNIFNPESESMPEEFDGDASNKWQLLIEYDNENQLAKAFDKAKEEGLKCKIIQ
jgi:ParB-like chromosome segregation protein Spo0J